MAILKTAIQWFENPDSRDLTRQRIEAHQLFFQKRGIPFLAESDCDKILASYAQTNGVHVVCPYKPGRFLTKKSGNAGRTTVHIVYNRARVDKTGIGSVIFGNTPFEAKLNYVRSLVDHGYFKLTPELEVINPLIF